RLHARARGTGARRRRAARPAARALLLHRLLLRAGRAAGARRRRARVYRRRRRGACDSEPRALGAASELAAPALPPRVDLLAGGEPDAFLPTQVVVDLLEIADPVRHAVDVGMHGDRHHPRRLRALGVHAIELVAAALPPRAPRALQARPRRERL